MGEQQWTETASNLRANSEDALDDIREWEAAHRLLSTAIREVDLAPPFVLDGYWADYADIEKTFPEDWREFNDRERSFFSHLWQVRSYGVLRTYAWLLHQQLRLIRPRVIWEVGFGAWLLYLPLQIISFAALTLALLRKPKILSRTLADVRIYADPRGIVERAIVQRIDRRVGRAFLQLIGLDEEFRPLTQDQRLTASGKAFVADRVVWVAHSLGTVISYNVLSDLFHRAEKLRTSSDKQQREGAEKFRKALRRFVTLGSPLDKFAYLFEQSLRPWPEKARSELLEESGESAWVTLCEDFQGTRTAGLRRRIRKLFGRKDPDASTASEQREWWINFYDVLDPVSGALGHSKKDPNNIYCGEPPLNVHITGWKSWIPGWAHAAYWLDDSVLRFVLSRVYGKEFLPDDTPVPASPNSSMLKALGYIVWTFILYGGVIALIWKRSAVASFAWKTLVSSIKAVAGL